MPRKTDEERKAELLARKAKIDERLKAIEAKSMVQNRKDDTRRKILAGSVILQHLTSGEPKVRAWLRKELDKALTKERDRALFAELLAQEPTA